ncbi:MAG: methyl-accepting chemotaxis protein [Lachnospiraceae bacterium]|nr:methyl-accepting chemotaxis protein [Lachnospiraceae bacterium]
MAKIKTSKKNGIKLNFFLTIVLTILISVVVSVVSIMLLTLPASEEIIKNRVLNYIQAEAIRAKYELEKTGSAEILPYEQVNKMFGEEKLDGMPGSYVYIVKRDGRMLYHPSQDKIGNPVENECVKALVAELETGKIPDDGAMAYEYKGAIKYAGYGITRAREIVVVTADEKEALSECSKLTLRGVLCGVIVAAILLAVGLFVAKIIAEPLKQIAEFTKKLSEGYLNNEMSAKSPIVETKEIADAAVVLQDNLRTIVNEIRSASSNLTDSVNDTNGLCNTSADGAMQITSAVDELATAAQSMAEAVQDLNSNIIEIGGNIETISGAVDALNASSASMNNISDEAAEDIKDVYASSERSVEAVEAIAQHMDTLTTAINDVSNATKLINDISSQTNLLSLNASIEAARAGEAGRGFAVVAQEIGSLATQSSDSASQIDAIANNIIELSKQSASLTEKIKEIINEEQSKVKTTQDSFLKLKDMIDNSIMQIDQISNETTKLATAKEAAISAVSDLSAISEENAASNEEVTASVTGLSSNISDISGRSDDMSEMAVSLNEAIKAFKE